MLAALGAVWLELLAEEPTAAVLLLAGKVSIVGCRRFVVVAACGKGALGGAPVFPRMPGTLMNNVGF